ncbi:hypothetical protein CspeluHIS016_0205610 [Cutaneotrichosporon spelunceum]|uniref:Uncharacterized protein n=1 Tax=Cutaneotrichosporon spelunceum TaxID=1672016 RepID=A0AAD3YA02_9TREE|nr:hypothetical protein CspeluHIS016_0205610 [Cutaneotrichosporon spelunceum]
MFARSARTLATASRAPVLNNSAVAGRRWTSIEHRNGKSKLIYRFGMKDIPVELYPLGFVVSMGLVGGVIAIGRHFAIDSELRLHRQGSSPNINKH